MVEAAERGDHVTRARVATAYRVHVLRLADGKDDDADDEDADAGALLDARSAFAAERHRDTMEAIVKALANVTTTEG